MKNLFLYVCLILLLGYNIYLIYIKNEFEKDIYVLEQNLLIKNEYLHSISELLDQTWSNNRLLINNSLPIIDSNGNRKTLKDITKPVLVVRNMESGCNLCIENELKILKKYRDLYQSENVIILSDHDSGRKLKVFKNSNNLDSIQVASCKNLGLPFEKEFVKPYVFLLDKNNYTSHFFIPEVTRPEVSEKYYKKISKLLNHQ